MNELSAGPDQTKWEAELVNDLAFIKKKRRYPLSKMTLMPLGSSVFVILSLIWLTRDYLFGEKNYGNRFPFVIVFIVAIPVLVSIARYFNLIRFRAIHTPLFLTDNMRIIQQFLEDQKLVTFRHPKLPEVFQILSRNISAMGEDREILIFIADDMRILINSHYTSSRKWFRFLSPPTHEKEMIKLFMEWLARHPLNGSASMVQRGFS